MSRPGRFLLPFDAGFSDWDFGVARIPVLPSAMVSRNSGLTSGMARLIVFRV